MSEEHQKTQNQKQDCSDIETSSFVVWTQTNKHLLQSERSPFKYGIGKSPRKRDNQVRLSFSNMIRNSAVIEYSFTRMETGLLLTKDRAVEKESEIDFSRITLNKEVEMLGGSMFEDQPEMPKSPSPETEIESMY